jgi:hypothetical protein
VGPISLEKIPLGIRTRGVPTLLNSQLNERRVVVRAEWWRKHWVGVGRTRDLRGERDRGRRNRRAPTTGAMETVRRGGTPGWWEGW